MEKNEDRAFTLKSLLAGLFSSLLVAVVFESNRIILQPAIVTSYLPAVGISLVCLFAFPWNALIGRLIPFLRFSKRELVVVFGMVVLVMVPVGQITGTFMTGLPSLRAYSVNVAGALTGIVLFALARAASAATPGSRSRASGATAR